MRYILLVSVILFSSAAAAAPITTNTLNNPLVQDFNSIPFTPVQQNSPTISFGNGIDAQVSTNTSQAIIGRAFSFGLLDNGTWTGTGARGAYVSVSEVKPTCCRLIRFDFTTLVSGVGAFMNYIAGTPSNPEVSISVFDDTGAVLETLDVLNNAPISTPGGTDEGAFRGFQRSTADIAAIEFYGNLVVLDDLSIEVGGAESSVPAPEVLSLVLVSVSLVALRRRKPRSSMRRA